MQRFAFHDLVQTAAPIIHGSQPQHGVFRRPESLRAPELELRPVEHEVDLRPFMPRQRTVGVRDLRKHQDDIPRGELQLRTTYVAIVALALHHQHQREVSQNPHASRIDAGDIAEEAG